MIRVRRALLSVSDKKGLIPFAKGLVALGVRVACDVWFLISPLRTLSQAMVLA